IRAPPAVMAPANTIGSRPARAAYTAAVYPAGPDPMMMTSRGEEGMEILRTCGNVHSAQQTMMPLCSDCRDQDTPPRSLRLAGGGDLGQFDAIAPVRGGLGQLGEPQDDPLQFGGLGQLVGLLRTHGALGEHLTATGIVR